MKINKYQIDILMKLGFVAVLIGLFFNLRLDQYFFSGPIGIHYTRQTDSLAFASQYYNTGNGLFNPSLYSFDSVEGRAACEFPILYYISSFYYSVFGENFFILKLLNLILIYSGIYCVFNISYRIIKDYFYAFMVALLLFTSTVFNYYSFNFLPDSGALGLIFIGWFFFLKFDSNRRKRTLLLSTIFFTLGGLIKVTFLLNPLSILAFYVGGILFKKLKINHEIKSILLSLSLGIALVVVWNFYIVWYNGLYHSEYFTTSSRAIWSISSVEISNVWGAISNYWYNSYFAYTSHHLVFVLIILNFFAFRKLNPKMKWISLILLGGTGAFFLLFYSQFKDHDYYFLTLTPIILLMSINGITFLQKISSNKLIQLCFKLVFLIVILIGINYSRGKLIGRLTQEPDLASKTGLTIEKELPEIEKLNIEKDAVFIVAPDRSRNGSLLFLNRQGWQFNTTDETTEQKIKDFTSMGANYLLFATDKPEQIAIGNKLGELIYSSEKLKIFKLFKI